MTRARLVTLVLVFAVAAGLAAPAPVSAGGEAVSLLYRSTWGGCTGSGALDVAEGIAVAPDRDIYVAGRTTVTPGGTEDALFLKFSPGSPGQNWRRRWGGAAQDAALSVAVGSDGAIYAAGGTLSFGTRNAFVMRLNPANSGTLWRRTWGTIAAETATGVAVAPDGSVVYVAGQVDEGSFILRVNAATGALMTQRTWSGGLVAGQLGRGDSIDVAPDGSVYIAGTTAPGLGEDPFVMQLDPVTLAPAWDGGFAGAYTWTGGGGDAEVMGMAASDSGAVIATVAPFAGLSGVLGVDPDGTILFQRTFPIAEVGLARDVALDDYSVVLSADSAGAGGIRAVTMNPTGVPVEFHSILDSNILGSVFTSLPWLALRDAQVTVAGTLQLAAAATLAQPGLVVSRELPVPQGTEPGVVPAELALATTPGGGTYGAVGGVNTAATGAAGPPIGVCGSTNFEAFALRYAATLSGEVRVSRGVKVALEGGSLFGFLVDICRPTSPYFDAALDRCRYPLSSDPNIAVFTGNGAANRVEILDGEGQDIYVINAHGGNDEITATDGPGPDTYRARCGTGAMDRFTFVDAHPSPDVVKRKDCELM